MNVSHDEALLALRPPIISEATQMTPAEQFQNETLRPLLKLQNDLLLSVFQGYLQKRKNTFAQMAANDQVDYIDHTIRQDQKFKNLLVGLILGHFTTGEWQVFQADEAELTRRIVTLLIQRIQYQLVPLSRSA